MVNISFSDPVTVSILLDGEVLAKDLHLDDACALRKALTAALAPTMRAQSVCRVAWKQTAKGGYLIGKGEKIWMTKNLDGDPIVSIHYRENNKHKWYQVDLPQFIDYLATKDQAKAREVFAQWL